MVRQHRPGSARSPHSPRADHVGEIDTAAPIQSVKAAVSLFGEVGPARARPITRRSSSDERVLEKETQHHMKLRELDHYKDQLKSAQIEKARAQKDLQRANQTLRQLTNRLETLSELKQASIKATEAAKIRAQELEEQIAQRAHLGSDAWKVDLENERESYKAAMGQLTAFKQELDKLRHDFHSALEQKMIVFQKAEEAQNKAQADQERQSQLENKVQALRQKLGKLQLDSRQTAEEHSKIITEKEGYLQARRLAKEEAEREIQRLREEYEPAETLQEKLEETTEAVKVLEEQVKELHSSDLYALKTIFSELEKSKKSLQESLEEEKTLRSSIESIKQELEEVKKDCLELEKKALEAESSADRMQAELEKRRTELNAAISGCASNMKSSIDKLLSEAEHAIRVAEESKSKAELLKKEAEASRLATEEAKEKLKDALEEADAAKKVADDKVYNYSGPVRAIRMSAEEFESMKKKIEGFRSEADVKVATAMAQKQTIATREKVISQKLAGVLEENETIEAGIKDAMKRAEMAEATRRMVEGELQKWSARI